VVGPLVAVALVLLCDTATSDNVVYCTLNASHILRIVPYFLLNPQRHRTISVLVYTIYSYQITQVISLRVTLSSECYLETSSILLTPFMRTILYHYVYSCVLPTMYINDDDDDYDDAA